MGLDSDQTSDKLTASTVSEKRIQKNIFQDVWTKKILVIFFLKYKKESKQICDNKHNTLFVLNEGFFLTELSN